MKTSKLRVGSVSLATLRARWATAGALLTVLASGTAYAQVPGTPGGPNFGALTPPQLAALNAAIAQLGGEPPGFTPHEWHYFNYLLDGSLNGWCEWDIDEIYIDFDKLDGLDPAAAAVLLMMILSHEWKHENGRGRTPCDHERMAAEDWQFLSASATELCGDPPSSSPSAACCQVCKALNNLRKKYNSEIAKVKSANGGCPPDAGQPALPDNLPPKNSCENCP